MEVASETKDEHLISMIMRSSDPSGSLPPLVVPWRLNVHVAVVVEYHSQTFIEMLWFMLSLYSIS